MTPVFFAMKKSQLIIFFFECVVASQLWFVISKGMFGSLEINSF